MSRHSHSPWRHLSVRARLLGLTASLFLAFVAGSLLLTFLVERNHGDQIAGVEQSRRFQAILDTEQAMGLYRHHGSQINAASMLGDADKERLARAAYADSRHALDERLQVLGGFDRNSHDIVSGALDEIPDYTEQVMAALRTGHQVESAPALAELQRRLDLIEDTLQSARRRELDTLQQIQRRAFERANVARHVGLGLTLVIVVSGVLLIVTVVRSILRPLRITTEAIRQVNSGALDIDLPPPRRDEFGEMAQAIRHFRDRAEKLERLAYYDTLTGLGNRERLEETLERTVALCEKAGRKERCFALVALDLDNFASINQRLGHRLGDRYLSEAATRLQRFLPPEVALFRHSGDKFAAVVEASEGEASFEDRLKSLADVVLRGVSEPYLIPNHLLNMSVSMGISIYPEDGSTVEQIFASAQSAVIAAKQSGRNTMRFAGGKMASQLRRQKSLANEIRRGLQNGEFEVFYQPIVDFGSGLVSGAEALTRWRHPQRGLLTAGEFITAAEEEGLVGKLGQRCLEAVHRQSEIWQRAGHHWRLAVNLSARQLQQENLLDSLRNARLGIAEGDHLIDLELTESALFDTSDPMRELLNSVRRQGYRIGMDDFGTGYSSFTYLQWLPVDKIKIDRQFVCTMEASKQAMGIISATMALARNLGLEVVAEGVETAQQAALLAEMGCTLHQGFHYSPAVPADAFEIWAQDYAAGHAGLRR